MPVQDVPSSALVIGQSDVTCVEADSNTNPRKDHPGFVPDIPRPKRTSGRTGAGGARQTPCRKHVFRRLLVGHPSRLHSPAPLRLSLTRSNFDGGFVMPSPKAHAAVMQRTEKRRRLGNNQGGLCARAWAREVACVCDQAMAMRQGEPGERIQDQEARLEAASGFKWNE